MYKNRRIHTEHFRHQIILTAEPPRAIMIPKRKEEGDYRGRRIEIEIKIEIEIEI